MITTHLTTLDTFMTSKYLKFGLRADKNLADVTSATASLSNLLDDISVQFDPSDSTIAYGFSSIDIAPLVGLRNTGLADYVTASGRSTDLEALNGSEVLYTPVSGSTRLEVQPRITIQDNINNFRSVLANPPWTNGGGGPDAHFVTADRIHNTITASTTGNRASSAPADLGNNIYSTIVSDAYGDIIGPVDFWNNGVFELGSKLHPTFPNTYGLIQWTGYLSSVFTQQWESTGLFIIEEDIIDDGTDNNWVTLKNVWHRNIPIANCVSAIDGANTVITLGTTVSARLIAVKQICKGMKVTVSSTEYEVDSVDEVNGTVTIIGANFTESATSHTFSFGISDDIIETGLLNITQPARGGRTRIRYTLWWPEPSQIGLAAGSSYRTKRFAYSILNSDRLPYAYLYNTYDRDQVFGPYTYKYFSDNKGDSLTQRSSNSIRVNNTFSMNYEIPTTLAEVVKGLSSGVDITPRVLTVGDTYGKFAGNCSSYEVGDHIVFVKSGVYYTYQIQEVRINSAGDDFAYFNKDILTDASLSTGDTISVIAFKNLGLIGLFKLTASSATAGSLYAISGDNIAVTEVYADYLVFGISADGTSTATQPMRIMSCNASTNPKAIVTAALNGNGSTLTTATDEICAVYSTKGLDDLSSVAQCTGVYGREVASAAGAGSTTITLTTTVGVSAANGGDYVQFAGLGGIADPVLASPTRVIGISGNVITIAPAIRTGKTLNGASTLIFIKQADYATTTASNGVNKEYCVIPLNTAPPFEGTDEGLKTPDSTPNLTVVGLTFAELDVALPSASIVDLAVSPLTNQRGDQTFPIVHGTTTYKALINTSG